jgi:hypothetical protein
MIQATRHKYGPLHKRIDGSEERFTYILVVEEEAKQETSKNQTVNTLQP